MNEGILLLIKVLQIPNNNNNEIEVNADSRQNVD